MDGETSSNPEQDNFCSETLGADMSRYASNASDQVTGQSTQSVDPGAGQPTQSVDPGAGQPTQSVDAGAGQPTQSIDPGAGQPTQSIDPTAGQPNAAATPLAAPVTSPPASLRSAIGSADYYRQRNADFISRAATGQNPPDYYLGYGEKYIARFTTELRPNLSSAGQAWVDCTVRALQTSIEDRLDADPAAFAQLEHNSSAFHDFAFATHPDAYVSCGVCELSIVDELKIVWTPDLRDLVTLGGLSQMLNVFAQCNSNWFTPRGPAT